jgi:hypothetical protein
VVGLPQPDPRGASYTTSTDMTVGGGEPDHVVALLLLPSTRQ